MPFRLVSSPADAVLILINFIAPALDAVVASAAETALGFKNKKETVLKIRQSPKIIEIIIDFFIQPPFPFIGFISSSLRHFIKHFVLGR